MNNTTEILEEALAAYEKPTVSSYTEAELLESMEAWGASGGTIPYTGPPL